MYVEVGVLHHGDMGAVMTEAQECLCTMLLNGFVVILTTPVMKGDSGKCHHFMKCF